MACTPDLDRPWELSDPRRDRTVHPYNDADTVEIIDGAVTTLVLLRAPMWLGDAGPTISVLVSLGYEAGGRLHDAVADARDQGYSWDQIADRLDTSVATARRRYASYVGWKRRTRSDGLQPEPKGPDRSVTNDVRPLTESESCMAWIT